MVYTHMKKQSKRRVLSQLKDFDQELLIGNTVNDWQEVLRSLKVLVTRKLSLVFLTVV